METPDVWIVFGSYIHQDFLLDYPDLMTGIQKTLENFSSKQKEELYLLLKEICQGDYSLREKFDFWLSSGASIYVDPKDTSDFLNGILIELERSID